MLIDQIKKDSLVARKARETDKATLLSTLYSEASMIGKNDGNRETSDAEVVQTVKKFLKGVNENLERLGKEEETSSNSMGLAVALNKFETEMVLLSKYLPIQLREDELTVIINDIIETSGFSSMKDMGKVMGLIKENYDGMFDGGLASKIVRESLA